MGQLGSRLMKLAVRGSKTLRVGIIVSCVFLVAAIALLLAGRHVVPDIAYMPPIIAISGPIAFVLAPFIPITSYLHTAAPREQGASEKA